MPRQLVGYYNSLKASLLDDFDRASELMNPSLVVRYGEELADALRRDARSEYELLIPDIPFITGLRARLLNIFLLITAQEVAVYKAMKKRDMLPGEAWEVCHEALRMNVSKIPRWKRWLLRNLMFSGFVKKIMARRALRQEIGRFGDFEIEYVVGDGRDFDVGVNYLKCGNYQFAITHGAEAFAPYICMSDIALSDAMGWGLTRTQTLADGCDHCDFRMKKGAATQISSKSPAVQATIDGIRAKEAEHDRSADV
jgi:hypothetical protein